MAEQQQEQNQQEKLASQDVEKQTSRLITEDEARALIQSFLNEIGGWKVRPDEISAVSGKFNLKGNLEQILIGGAKDPSSGIGIFLGLSGGQYQFRVGDKTGEYILWDGSTLEVKGNLLTEGKSFIQIVAGENLLAGDIVYLKKSDNKVYKAYASQLGENLNVLGVVKDTTSAGQTANIQITGAVDYSFGNNRDTIAETIDQQFPSGQFSSKKLENDDQFTFITGKAVGNLTKIDIYFDSHTGDPSSHSVYCELMKDNQVVATSNSITPTQNSWNTFTFGDVAVEPNSTYTIRFKIVYGGSYANDYFNLDFSNDSSYSRGWFFTPYTGTIYKNDCCPFKTYYTTKNNYDYGDYVYLGDIAGSIVYSDYATNIVKVGEIISSTQYIINRNFANVLKDKPTIFQYQASFNPIGIGRNFAYAIVMNDYGEGKLDKGKTSVNVKDSTAYVIYSYNTSEDYIYTFSDSGSLGNVLPALYIYR